MLAVPMLVVATFWSWRMVSSLGTGRSLRLVVWWFLGVSILSTSLVASTLRIDDVSWWSPIWMVWGGLGGVIGVLWAIDVDVHLLPRQVSLSTFVVSVVALSIIEGPSDLGRWGPLAGAAAMTAIAALLRVVSRRSLGMGDVLVSPLLGAIIGWFDPWSTVTAWVVAAVGGGLGALVGLWRGASRHKLVAYGPFLFVGTAMALLGTVI